MNSSSFQRYRRTANFLPEYRMFPYHKIVLPARGNRGAAFLLVRQTAWKMLESTSAFSGSMFNNENLLPKFFRITNRCAGTAPGGPAVDRQRNGSVVYHIAIALQHTFFIVLPIDKDNIIGLTSQGKIYSWRQWINQLFLVPHRLNHPAGAVATPSTG